MAEVVRRRTKADKPSIGLASRGGSRIAKSAITIAKNYYYTQDEFGAMNNLAEHVGD